MQSAPAARTIQTGDGPPNLDQLPPGAQLSKGERWIFAGHDHEMEQRRQMIDQEGHGRVDHRVGEEVIIVEDDDEIVR